MFKLHFNRTTNGTCKFACLLGKGIVGMTHSESRNCRLFLFSEPSMCLHTTSIVCPMLVRLFLTYFIKQRLTNNKKIKC
jgi:hypothetical protein